MTELAALLPAVVALSVIVTACTVRYLEHRADRRHVDASFRRLAAEVARHQARQARLRPRGTAPRDGRHHQAGQGPDVPPPPPRKDDRA